MFGYKQNHVDHTMFIKRGRDTIIVNIVWEDDVVVTDNDMQEMSLLNAHLSHHFEIKDLDLL